MDRSCPVCKSTSNTSLPRYSESPWKVVQCDNCEMVFLNNPPSPEATMDELDWDGSKGDERAKRRKKKGPVYYFFSDGIKKIRAFSRSFRPRKEIRYISKFAEGPRVLDIGCGGGHILAALPENFIPHGVEPSPTLHAAANSAFQKRGGYCLHGVAHLGLAELPANQKFDLILMRSFLEHDAMAAQTLQAAHSRLAEGGKVLLKVPTIGCWNAKLRGSDWPGIRHPDHVNYFTPRTLTQIFRKNGFSKVEIPLAWRLPTSDNLWALAHR